MSDRSVAGSPVGFLQLSQSEYGWVAPYLGKVGAAVGRTAGAGGETCSAVVVAPLWVLTAAHCVHHKNPGAKPWTPQYFVGMYPLDSLIFSSVPVGKGGIYRIVDVVKSDQFPDPGAATDDWVFLKLNRPPPVDPQRIPEVAPSRDFEDSRNIKVSGFLRTYTDAGAIDWTSINEPYLSQSNCRIEAYVDRIYGPMRNLIDVDCIPPVNHGLSGGPLLVFEADGPKTTFKIIGIQMGSGQLTATNRQVPVLVRSEQFLAAYHKIIGASP